MPKSPFDTRTYAPDNMMSSKTENLPRKDKSRRMMLEEEDTIQTSKNDIYGENVAKANRGVSFLAHRSTTSMINTVTIKYPLWHNVLAGGIAGAGARLFTAPLDLIRIRAQLERKDVYPRPSIVSRMIQIYNAEGGLKALFRGNLAASYLWVGYSAVQFSVYGRIKEGLDDTREELLLARQDNAAIAYISNDELIEKEPLWEGFKYKVLTNPTAVAFLAGAGAGICATIATYPFDICRTVFASRGALTQQQQELQQQRKQQKTTMHPKHRFQPPSTIKECAFSMYQQDGIRGFYAGSTPAVVQIVPYMGMNFAIYDFLVTQGENHSKSIGLSGYAGSISGAVSKMIVYPMDTIKKRIQIQSVFGTAGSTSNTNAVHYKGIWDCFATTVRTEGIAGLYRGLFPSVLKTTLGSGLSFSFFRTTKNLLESIHDYSQLG